MSDGNPGGPASDSSRRALVATVLVAALGYFVDVYDLQLFSIVRVASLRALGVPESRLLADGILLINLQMAGMLLGGFGWGALGDRRGRVSVLFGSITVYTIANLANACVHSIAAYGAWRFVAGLGLAGELGAGVTLVAEILPPETRTWGTTAVAVVGLLGAVAAAVVGELLPWNHAYLLGGVLGVALLAARLRLFESGMYQGARASEVRRGDLGLLFGSPARLARYLRCVALGVPIWFVLGVLVTFAPEVGRALGVTAAVLAPRAVLATYVGIVAGNLASGALGQRLRSRRRVLAVFLAATALAIALVPAVRGTTPGVIYLCLAVQGVAIGYWGVFVTVASEQFGTNLRATVTTSAANVVRGCVVPLTLSFQALRSPLGIVHGAMLVGAGTVALAFAGLWGLPESYGRPLDYLEFDGPGGAPPGA